MSRGFRQACAIGLLLVMGSATGPGAADPQDQPASRAPSERTGVTIQLLDVEVVDEEGNPVRGLTKGDFAVWIDTRRVDVYSVDDLCACPGPGAPGLQSTDRAPGAAATGQPATVSGEVGRLDPVRFVFYFDFSQLQADGREAAESTAAEWLERLLPVGAEAMLAGFHSDAGLREISPFTRDRARLAAALHAAFEDPTLVDPFPSMFRVRVESCQECCSRCSAPCLSCCADPCIHNPRREFEHGRRSYRGLTRFLERLEAEPGRKALFLFQQNANTFPNRFYPFPVDTGDHIAALDQIGAEAALARTAIHTAVVGSPTHQAGNVAVNLADFTGGSHSGTGQSLVEWAGSVIRDCSCTYRIAFVPTQEPDNRVHQIRVEVAGRTLPFRYRLAFLDERSRWWRTARSVLEDPSAARDVAVRVGLVPLGRTRAGWDLSAQVALDPDTLTLIPSADRQSADWEVGGLLHREQGKAWEMLGVSSLRTTSRVPHNAGITHERVFSELPGGTYSFGAFVRDRAASVFGGAETTIDLPRPGTRGMVGPLGREADRLVWITVLPLLKHKANAGSRAPTPTIGSLPLEDAPVIDPGPRLELLTWICPERPDLPASLVRWVDRETERLFRFEAPRLERAGDCYRLEDSVLTTSLAPGDYGYYVRWVQVEGEDPVEGRFDFTIRARAEAPAAVAEAPEAVDEPDPRLPAVLEALARVADSYRDRALEYTCDETITFREADGRRTRHEFRYVYVHEGGELRDYRVSRDEAAAVPPRALHLGSLDLPAYLVRAYSWVFLFGNEMREHYRYRVVGDGEVAGRPALEIAFEPVPPYVVDKNDWFGTAWIDRESHLFLRVRAFRIEDRLAVETWEAGRGSSGASRGQETHGTWQRYDTEFGVLERGMRFPSHVEIRRFARTVQGSTRRVFLVTQQYRNFRFFDVEAHPRIRGAEVPARNGAAQRKD